MYKDITIQNTVKWKIQFKYSLTSLLTNILWHRCSAIQAYDREKQPKKIIKYNNIQRYYDTNTEKCKNTIKIQSHKYFR